MPLHLTGPAAAGILRRDGFRDHDWPLRWCTSHGGAHGERIIRTRTTIDPLMVGDLLLVQPALILRHLGTDLRELERSDGIDPLDRIELAAEHVLRDGLATLDDLRTFGGSHPGDVALRTVLRRRDDPTPTESYAETRAVQLLRRMDIRCWRQVRIWADGRIRHRADLMIPVGRWRAKPERVRPSDGLLIEVDSREHHEGRFEEDHQRQSTYDALGYRWVTLTPNQVEHQRSQVERAVRGALRSLR